MLTIENHLFAAKKINQDGKFYKSNKSLVGPSQGKSTFEDAQNAHSDHSAHAQSIFLGPVVQSVVSLMNSLVIKMVTVLVNTISTSQELLLKKCE